MPDLVGNPEDRFSCDTAQIFIFSVLFPLPETETEYLHFVLTIVKTSNEKNVNKSQVLE